MDEKANLSDRVQVRMVRMSYLSKMTKTMRLVRRGVNNCDASNQVGGDEDDEVGCNLLPLLDQL